MLLHDTKIKEIKEPRRRNNKHKVLGRLACQHIQKPFQPIHIYLQPDQPVLLRAMRDAEENLFKRIQKKGVGYLLIIIASYCRKFAMHYATAKNAKTRNDLQAKCPQSTRMVCLHA